MTLLPEPVVGTLTDGLVRSVREAAHDALSVAPGPGQRHATPTRTGFDVLDRVLGGGLRPTDLALLGGSPGVGKTVAALQMARRAALDGRTCVYVSFEHDQATMLGRLLALEVAEIADADHAVDSDRLARVLIDATAGFRSLRDVITSEPIAAKAFSRLDLYSDRLLLVRGSGSETDVTAIEAILDRHADAGDLLVVDYLQRVATPSPVADEHEHVTLVTQALKDLAMRRRMAVMALVAADWDGLRSGRLRLHHLRGSSALAYECDVAVLLNDKHHAVAKAHLAYDPLRAETFHHYVVFSVEKNRGGPAMVDLEFRKDFLHYRFDTAGEYLRERLVDDRLAGE
ncbi:DnaB-like helicase C-terminal domain-containing protein [Egicoccus sp. AB-alg2]|uniref:DnaB-like helicase C-terminal domain-containing protein n=1 Tax=Egicoccus sp. AB-alg2 TaxID=3242693 RepID=UPI00359D3FEA